MTLIAIIDDDESFRIGLAGLVRSLGYASATFASAREFLESAEARASACLITDVQMPGTNGLELQRLLIATGRTLPIIFITAYPEDRIRDAALAAGAFGFFHKPFKADDLALCLTAVCGVEEN